MRLNWITNQNLNELANKKHRVDLIYKNNISIDG